MDTYLSELKSNRKKTIKRVAKCLLWLAFIATLFYFAVFSTGCTTAYNVSTELREIQIEMPHRIKPQYEKIDYKPVKKGVVFKTTEDGVFINNANVNIMGRNLEKLGIQIENGNDINDYLIGIMKASGFVFV